MAAVWHPLPDGTRPASVALCGKTHPTVPEPTRICGFVRKDAPTLAIPARIRGLVRKDASHSAQIGPHLWPCAERRHPRSREDQAVACPGGTGRDQLEPDPRKLLSRRGRRLTQGGCYVIRIPRIRRPPAGRTSWTAAAGAVRRRKRLPGAV